MDSQIETDTGAIVGSNLIVQPMLGFPIEATAHTIVHSNTGPVVFSTVLTPGIVLETGGFLSANSIASGHIVSGLVVQRFMCCVRLHRCDVWCSGRAVCRVLHRPF